MVGRIAVPAVEDRGLPAAQVVADDADGRRGATGPREAEPAGLLEHAIPLRPALHAGDLGAWVDLHAGHPGQVQQHRAAGRVHDLVSGGEHGDRQIPFGCEPHDLLHVRGARRADRDSRAYVVSKLNVAHSASNPASPGSTTGPAMGRTSPATSAGLRDSDAAVSYGLVRCGPFPRHRSRRPASPARSGGLGGATQVTVAKGRWGTTAARTSARRNEFTR